MKWASITAILIFSPFISGVCAQEFGKPQVNGKRVALVALIIDPQLFNEASIQVAGVFYWHPDGSYLFLNGESYDALDGQSAIQIASGLKQFPSGVTAASLEKLNGQVVWIEGVVYVNPSNREPPIIKDITWLKKVNRTAEDQSKGVND